MVTGEIISVQIGPNRLQVPSAKCQGLKERRSNGRCKVQSAKCKGNRCDWAAFYFQKYR